MKKLLFALLFTAITSIYPHNGEKYINVTGTSEIIVMADQLEISININTVKNSLLESKKNNDESVADLINILSSSGITKESIDISPISLGKHYDYDQGKRVHKGYFTSVRVNFILKDLTVYYDLLDKISQNDLFEISNSSYKISDYESKYRHAYQKALLAAKQKAELMAKTLEIKLGDVIEIEENNSDSTPILFASFAKEGYQSGAIEGKVNISRSVRVKFAIM